MNTTRFEYMLALKQLGTISKAAEKYFISPSAMSQCLKTEEKELGFQLFERKNGTMIPTQAGEIYLKGAQKILDIQKQTFHQLQASSGSRNQLRLLVSPMLFKQAENLIRPALEQTFPHLEIQLAQADAKAAYAYLLNNLADLALLVCPLQNHALLSEMILGTDRLLLVVPKAYLRNKITSEPRLEDCRMIPFILTPSGSISREMENKILEKHHLTQIRIYETDHYLMAKQFLEDGRGAAFLPSSLLPENAWQHYYIIPPKAANRVCFLLVSQQSQAEHKAFAEIKTIIQKTWAATFSPPPLLP